MPCAILPTECPSPMCVRVLKNGGGVLRLGAHRNACFTFDMTLQHSTRQGFIILKQCGYLLLARTFIPTHKHLHTDRHVETTTHHTTVATQAVNEWTFQLLRQGKCGQPQYGREECKVSKSEHCMLKRVYPKLPLQGGVDCGYLFFLFAKDERDSDPTSSPLSPSVQ